MPAGYADLSETYRELGIDPVSIDPVEVAKRTHIQALDDQLTTAFDGKIGRTWRAPSNAATQRVVNAYADPILVLPAPVSSVTAVTVGGTWNGSTFTGGTALTASDWRLVDQDALGKYRAIQRVTNVWFAPWWGATDWWTVPFWQWPAGQPVVLVTAVWADTEILANVPIDVTRALTMLVIGEYRRETYNARESEQPFDPLDQTPAPNPWNLAAVKDAIARYTLKAIAV